MTTKLTVSNLQQMVAILLKYPALQQFPCFAPLGGLIVKYKQIINEKRCKCELGPLFSAYRPTFLAMLGNLQPSDVNLIKTVLKVSQFCYYIESNGKRIIKCA